MRKAVLVWMAVWALFSGCRNQSGVRGYWASRSVDIEDFDAAQEQFTEFAQLAAQAPEADAFAAVDRLLKKASKDTVTYLVYTEWINRAFSFLDSPCHNCDIFLHAADKALHQGILTQYATEEYTIRRNFCLYNRAGEKAVIPHLYNRDGTVFEFPLVQRTLFLVTDQNCPSCRRTMEMFRSPDWADTWLVALCYGRGPLPEEPGWDCYKLPVDQTIIDPREGPFYFVTNEQGIVETTYEKID